MAEIATHDVGRRFGHEIQRQRRIILRRSIGPFRKRSTIAVDEQHGDFPSLSSDGSNDEPVRLRGASRTQESAAAAECQLGVLLRTRTAPREYRGSSERGPDHQFSDTIDDIPLRRRYAQASFAGKRALRNRTAKRGRDCNSPRANATRPITLI